MAKLVAVAPTGEVIIVGTTTSSTLPGTSQAFQPTKGPGLPNNLDVFVSKFDSSGRRLLWSTFLGGDGNDVFYDHRGNDTMDGGAGEDYFAYLTYYQGIHTITGGAGSDFFNIYHPTHYNHGGMATITDLPVRGSIPPVRSITVHLV